LILWYYSPGLKYISTAYVSENAWLKQKRIIPGTKEELGFVVHLYSDRSPFKMKVERADIEGGFYGRMYGLQGKTGTGMAWLTQDSSLLC